VLFDTKEILDSIFFKKRNIERGKKNYHVISERAKLVAVTACNSIKIPTDALKIFD